MPSLLPDGFALSVYPGATRTVRVAFPTTVEGRTFTWQWGEPARSSVTTTVVGRVVTATVIFPSQPGRHVLRFVEGDETLLRNMVRVARASQFVSADDFDFTVTTAAAVEVDVSMIGMSGQSTAVNVADYGAVGNGTTDDTDAIKAAFAAGSVIHFPEGTFVFNGPAVANLARFTITGAGRGKTIIAIADGHYFINNGQFINESTVSDVTFSGGAGVVRCPGTTVNVGGHKVFQRVRFLNYTQAAVVSFASDEPYWKFDKCLFYGADFAATIGVALTGGTDSVSFQDCSFLRNRVAIKVGGGGENLYIRNCDFLRFSSTRPNGPAVDIWVVPDTAATISGQGLNVSSCKFGNENMVDGDHKVVYADQDTGDDFGTRFPDLDTASTGFITGHTFESCYYSGAANAASPFVFSTTPNVRACRYGPLVVDGTSGIPYIVEFLSTLAADRLNSDSLVGPLLGPALGTEGTVAPRVSNAVGWAKAVDPDGVFAAHPNTQLPHRAADPVDYVNLLPTLVRSFTQGGNPSLANVTDGFSGADATEVTFGTGSIVYAGLTADNITAGTPAWIEFDLHAGSSDALENVRVWVRYTSNGAFHFRRLVSVPTGWARYRFQWTPREKTTTVLLGFDSNSVAGKAQIGRVRCYHSREPQNVDGRLLNLAVSGNAGFYGTAPIAKQTGVAVTAEGIHAALVALGLISA